MQGQILLWITPTQLGGNSRDPWRFFTRQIEKEQELGPLLVHGKVSQLLGSNAVRAVSQPEQLQWTLEGKDSSSRRGCVFWEAFLSWRVIRHSQVAFMSFLLSPGDQKGLKTPVIWVCVHRIYTHHIYIYRVLRRGGGLHMSLAITQTFIIIVTIWLMGLNKPLLTWTLCAQISCSLSFFPRLSGHAMPSSCILVTLKLQFQWPAAS